MVPSSIASINNNNKKLSSETFQLSPSSFLIFVFFNPLYKKRNHLEEISLPFCSFLSFHELDLQDYKKKHLLLLVLHDQFFKTRKGCLKLSIKLSSLMENQTKPKHGDKERRKLDDGLLNGFSIVSTPNISWKSRKRSASARNLVEVKDDTANETPTKQEESVNDEKMEEGITVPELSERRKALFEPLEPVKNINGRRPLAESLLPPPDFDAANYPKGWLIGKKRKLVNVDVVESMRRIAVQEMNRKDREIDGLNEQLEEDARCLEHLQLQLLQERSKRAEVERDNAMLQDQVTMLMSMLQENEQMGDEGAGEEGAEEP